MIVGIACSPGSQLECQGRGAELSLPYLVEAGDSPQGCLASRIRATMVTVAGWQLRGQTPWQRWLLVPIGPVGVWQQCFKVTTQRCGHRHGHAEYNIPGPRPLQTFLQLQPDRWQVPEVIVAACH